MVTFWEVYQKAVKENGCNAGETFAMSMFLAGAEHNDAACSGFDDSVLTQHKEKDPE